MPYWRTAAANTNPTTDLMVVPCNRPADLICPVSAHVTVGETFKVETSIESFFTPAREDA